MIAWITLVVSALGNIINIVNNRENFKGLSDAFRDAYRRNAEKKAGIEFIRKIDPQGAINIAAATRSLIVYFFLLTITSSSVLSLFIGRMPVGLTLTDYAWFIYFYSSLILNCIFLLRIKDLGCVSYALLACTTVGIGWGWATLTNWISSTGVSLFYSGCIAGIATGIILALLSIKQWTVDLRV